jgi:hypothetical protein
MRGIIRNVNLLKSENTFNYFISETADFENLTPVIFQKVTSPSAANSFS